MDKNLSAGNDALKRMLYGFFLTAGLSVTTALAQISPGELITGHARWEGVENCTTCHTVGKSLSNDKCLQCHSEIDSRIKQLKGYHATIRGKLCEECHKEHHGKKFEIIRFDTAAFDHATVSFPLEGKHKSIGCIQCHSKGKIIADDVRKLSDERKSRSFLGLSQTCAACHEDQHHGQFSVKECSACHSAEKWKPAPKFSHNDSRYRLTGKHATVECQRCHKSTLEDGKTIRYTHMEFASCNSCHEDPHKGKFKQQCTTCHTTEDFHNVTKTVFDHEATKFPLKGKHAVLKCEDCHQSNAKQKNASGELGFHITKFQRCSDCHADAHAGQFAKRADGGQCEPCHSEAGFMLMSFTISDHRKTRFALAGAHSAVPCMTCHPSQKVNAKSTRQFHWDGTIQCTTCHEDIHKGQFAKKMPNGCESCHGAESWQKLLFVHDQTHFPLQGRHASVPCEKCHLRPNNSAAQPVQYTGLHLECAACHKDEHEGQFAVKGATDCSPCHNAVSWKSLLFDHNRQSRYPLTGRHADVACEKCHPKTSINQRLVAKYKPLGTACADCHREQQ